jgi:hypothetical protein
MSAEPARSAMAGLDRIRAVADAVLYEGYLLYPYRATRARTRSDGSSECWGRKAPTSPGSVRTRTCPWIASLDVHTNQPIGRCRPR